MDNRYHTLQTIYRIVRGQANPQQYLCSPREMFLHSTFDWDLILKHLRLLETEGLVQLQQLETPHCYMTIAGIEKAEKVIQERELAAPKEIQLKVVPE